MRSVSVQSFTIDPALLDGNGFYEVQVPISGIGVYQVTNLRFVGPAITTATTGRQKFRLSQLSTDGAVLEGFAAETETAAGKLSYTPGSYNLPTATTEAAVSGDWAAIRFSSGAPLYIQYHNNTDAAQTVGVSVDLVLAYA